MPSFDIVSEVDIHELTNAVDQAGRIIANRFDFKGVDAAFEREERKIVLVAEAEFQTEQMQDMLRAALIKCGIDPKSMEIGDPVLTGKQVKQTVEMRHGLPADVARKITKAVKETKIKVQRSEGVV